MGKSKVCIITTAHSPFDVRIFQKQAKTLVNGGYDVTLLAQHDKVETRDGVTVIPLPKPRNRITRIFGIIWLALKKSIEQRADLYHFHDPELIPMALVLRFLGNKVIYDIHEDYVTSLENKEYLPKGLRLVVARIFGFMEEMASHFFSDLIIAEQYYKERFPKAKKVLNYPILDKQDQTLNPPRITEEPKVLYTGTVAKSRGALIYANLVNMIDDLHVYLVGKCSPELAERIRSVAGKNNSRLHLEGEGEFVPHKRIRAYYETGRWLAGLAVFPPNPHYKKKEPTKFFEYMQAGIPVIASNFFT